MKKIQIVLIIGLIHGLVYVFLMPPWQHYDEPGHFEYAWLIANRLKLPQPGDYDQNMRLAVGKSLIDSSFFGSGSAPNLSDPTQPIWAGISQIIDPPLYYIIEAVPLFILKGFSVDLQLYAGRLVSLLFLLITIYSSYKLTRELTSADHPLQWMVPLFIAMLPAFAEFMTSLNDFVLAIALFSLWLVCAVKLIKRFSIKYAIYLLLITIAGFFTQKILYPLLLYLPIVILLSIFPRKFKYLAWVLTAVVGISGFLIVFSWKDAAFWLRANYQDFPTRTRVQESINNGFALTGKVYPDTTWGSTYPSWNAGFFQLVPSEIGDRLRGKTVTIGAWVWSDREITGYGPGVNSLLQFQDNWLGFKQEPLNQNPRFIASVVQIPEQQDRLQLWLRTTSVEDRGATIYISGIVLVEGVRPVDNPPTFDNSSGSTGIWGDQPFVNLARNAQFQSVWPYLKPQFFRLISAKIQDLLPFHISSFIAEFLDLPGTAWYTQTTSKVIFESFWAKFGWGQISLLSDVTWLRPYRLLFAITFLGIAGALVIGYKVAKPNGNAFIFLIFVTGTTIIVALLYGVYTMGGALRYRTYFPTARYIFPAVIPIALFLVIGWQALMTWVINKIKLPSQVSTIMYLGFLIVLDLYSFLSVLSYFHKS